MCFLSDHIFSFHCAGDWKRALERLLMTNNFPEFTGRVCPGELLTHRIVCMCALFTSSTTTNLWHLKKLKFIHVQYTSKVTCAPQGFFLYSSFRTCSQSNWYLMRSTMRGRLRFGNHREPCDYQEHRVCHHRQGLRDGERYPPHKQPSWTQSNRLNFSVSLPETALICVCVPRLLSPDLILRMCENRAGLFPTRLPSALARRLPSSAVALLAWLLLTSSTVSRSILTIFAFQLAQLMDTAASRLFVS
jgi:hypothetical protein